MSFSQANSAFARSTLATPITNIVSIPCAPKRILISDPNLPWRDSVLRRFGELVQLERGWDGYRAGPVNFDTAFFALRMLEAACDSSAPPPQIVPGSEGDMQVEWHMPDGDIELNVLAPNEVHAWRRTESTGSDGEEIFLTNDFAVVASWIRELTEPTRATGTAAA